MEKHSSLFAAEKGFKAFALGSNNFESRVCRGKLYVFI